MNEAAAQLRELSEPWERGDKIKAAIDRAAKAAGLGYWRAFDIWYGKARRVEAWEVVQISNAVRLKRERAAANELHELKFRLAKLEARLAQGDADFHRPDADYAREMANRLGGVGSSVAHKLKRN